MTTSCQGQAIAHAATSYADFLEHGPNANPDPFFLPNVFANDKDEVYPATNWWLCGSPPNSPVRPNGSLPNYGAAGPSELSRLATDTVARSVDSWCTSPTVAPSTTSTDGRRRRSRRPGSTSSSVSASTVATFRTPDGRTDGWVGNGLVGRASSSREPGEHSFRRGSGRSFSTPRFRTVSENGESSGVEAPPMPRRGAEDDAGLVRMKEHQELKNLLRAYQSSFLASYGRCAPL